VADESNSSTTFTQEQVDALVAEQLAGLKSNRDQALKEAKDAKKRLADYEGVDPAEFRKLKEAAAEAEQKKAEATGDWKAREKMLVDQFGKDLQARDAKIGSLTSALERRLIDSEAVAAIAAAKAPVKVLLPHIKSQVRVVEEDGEYVVHVVDGRVTRGSAMRRAVR